MKKIICILLAALLMPVVPAYVARGESAPELLWCDEFDGAQVDSEKWGFDVGNWLTDANGGLVTGGWGNNEKQFYRAENAAVSDGVLTISARRESVTDPAQGSYDYTSARLVTRGKFSVCGGRIEVRARVDSGASLWPAIWMLPEKEYYGGWAASGEIDIMEGWGSKPEKICGTIHYGDVWPNNVYATSEYEFTGGETTDGWHVYAVEWDEKSIRWYADDVLFGTQTQWYSAGRDFPAPFDRSFYIILNLAVGGHFDGVGDGTEADASIFDNGDKLMQVDYVRVYRGKTDFETDIPENIALDGYAMEGGEARFFNTAAGTSVEVASTGTKPYSVMCVLPSETLTAGKLYRVGFTAASSLEREIEVTVENSTYDRYFSRYYTVGASAAYTGYFTAAQSVSADLKLQLGAVKETPDTPHTVSLSSVRLTDVNAEYFAGKQALHGIDGGIESSVELVALKRLLLNGGD